MQARLIFSMRELVRPSKVVTIVGALILIGSTEFALAQREIPEGIGARERAEPTAPIGRPLAPTAGGTSATWNTVPVPTNGNWITGAADNNWSTDVGNYPGDTTTTNNGNTATFAASTVTAITISSSTLNIQNITFGTAASAFTITGGGFVLTDGGAISVSAGVPNTQTINTPILLSPATGSTYSFTNNSTTPAAALNIGGTVTGQQTSGNTTTLTLNGSNNGTVSNTIGDGSGGGKMGLTKADAGTWTLSGANTYTGATAVNGGTLLINGDQSSATGAISVNNTGTLGGTGSVGGAVTVNAGGNITGATNGTVGTLTLASTATFTGASSSSLATYLVDILVTASDRLTIGGALTCPCSRAEHLGCRGASRWSYWV